MFDCMLGLKGLVPTLASLGEGVEHRLCMKHLYANFRKKFPGDLMKQAIWKAARASTEQQFKVAMEEVKGINEDGYNDMMKLLFSIWSRSAYSPHSKCYLQDNNMCEAFNRAILDHRDKPIISLLEGFKFYITNRIVKMKDLMSRWRTSSLCPMIQQKQEVVKEQSDFWTCSWSGDEGYALFEVSRDNDKYVANLVA